MSRELQVGDRIITQWGQYGTIIDNNYTNNVYLNPVCLVKLDDGKIYPMPNRDIKLAEEVKK